MMRHLCCSVVVLGLSLIVLCVSSCRSLPQQTSWTWFWQGPPDAVVLATVLDADYTATGVDGLAKIKVRVAMCQRGELRANEELVFTQVAPSKRCAKGQQWLLCLWEDQSGNWYAPVGPKHDHYSFRTDWLVRMIKKEHPKWRGATHVKRTGANSFVLHFIDPLDPKIPRVVFVKDGQITEG